MAFVVGINLAVALKLVGVAARVDHRLLMRFYPLHWYAAALILLSGLALLLAYPAKALTNPLFYVKLAALTGGLSIAALWQRRGLAGLDLDRPRMLALVAILLWVITLFAGRFLAYTHSVLLASRSF